MNASVSEGASSNNKLQPRHPNVAKQQVEESADTGQRQWMSDVDIEMVGASLGGMFDLGEGVEILPDVKAALEKRRTELVEQAKAKRQRF